MAITEIVELTTPSIPGHVWMDLECDQHYKDYRTWLTARLREAYPGATILITDKDSWSTTHALQRRLFGIEAWVPIVSDAPTEQEQQAEIEQARHTIGRLMSLWLEQKPHRVDSQTAIIYSILTLVGYAAVLGGGVFYFVALGLILTWPPDSWILLSPGLALLCGHIYLTIDAYLERKRMERLGTVEAYNRRHFALSEYVALGLMIFGGSGLLWVIAMAPLTGFESGPILRGLAALLGGSVWWLLRSHRSTEPDPGISPGPRNSGDSR